MSVAPLKIVQLNMGRASAVNDQLLDYCQRRAIDIAMVQEPYTNRGKLTGFEVAPFRCFLSKATKRRGRTEYLDHGAAIIVFNPELVVVPREVGSTENFVSLDLDCGSEGVVTLISGYFKYRVPTELHVTVLEGLLRSAAGKVLLSMYANAFSKTWFSRITDRRGEILIASIDEHNLEIANVRSPYTTFHGPRGRTNIDVTLADPATRRKITGWAVEPGATSSDHQLIMFSICLSLRAYVNRESRFVLRKANHQKLVQTYEYIAALRDHFEMNPDHLAREIHEDITATAMVHAPRAKRRRKIKPPWYNRELQEARKAVRAAATTLVHNGNRQYYNSRRNAYTALLRKNKLDSRRAYCTTEGTQPWGRLYRWLWDGNKSRVTLGLMQRPDGTHCGSIDESVELLLNTLIPNDPIHQRQAQGPSLGCDVLPVSEADLKKFIWSISPNRAPGEDGISGSMVRMLWPCLAGKLLGLANTCIREARFPEMWKSAQMVPIIKGEDRDAGFHKSYRPVRLFYR